MKKLNQWISVLILIFFPIGALWATIRVFNLPSNNTFSIYRVFVFLFALFSGIAAWWLAQKFYRKADIAIKIDAALSKLQDSKGYLVTTISLLLGLLFLGDGLIDHFLSNQYPDLLIYMQRIQPLVTLGLIFLFQLLILVVARPIRNFISMNKAIREDNKLQAILLAGFGLFILALILYFTGNVRQNISGEAFYDFSFPARYSNLQSIYNFFFFRVRSRLVHGIFITILYDYLGYNPPLFYFVALVLLFLTGIITVLTLKEFIQHSWEGAWLVLAFGFIPLSVIQLFSLKKLHHILTWLFFWAAVWLIQKWIKTESWFWLVLGTIAFTGAILSYEAVIALLPVVLFLSNKHFKDFRTFAKKSGWVVFISVLSAVIFAALEGIKPSGGVNTAYGIDISTIPVQLLSFSKLPVAIWNNGLFSIFNTPPQWAIFTSKLLLLSAIALAIIIIIYVLNLIKRDGKSIRFISMIDNNLIALLLAGIWLSFFTYFPFIMAKQPPDSDSMLGAGQGFILIIFASYLWLKRMSKPAFATSILIPATAFWMFFAISGYITGINNVRLSDQKLYNFIYSMKQEIPSVQEKTTFILVNANNGRTGCIGLMNMIYEREQLHCIHLLDGDTEEGYIRQEDGLVENTGKWFGEDYIIITFDEYGYVQVIEEITQSDYPDVPVIWESELPLITNAERILIDEINNDSSSPIYDYALKHHEVKE